MQLVLVLMLGAREQLYVGTLTGLSTRSLAEYRQTFFGLGCWLCDKERNDIGYDGVNNNNAHFRCDDLNVCYFGSLKRTTAADGYLNALLGHRRVGADPTRRQTGPAGSYGSLGQRNGPMKDIILFTRDW